MTSNAVDGHSPYPPAYGLSPLYSSPDRNITRTPSPTPSELEELQQTSMFGWMSAKSKKRNIWFYILLLVIIIAVIVGTILHNKIVTALQPAANWMHNLPAGFLIPIAILFVMSFPPLFGHEIVAIMCGLTWGAGIGFGIVCAGQLLGELASFLVFKYLCRARSQKLQKKNIKFASLVMVVREGGFKIAIIARYSVIPPHFTTAIFATCRMSLWIFLAAAVLSLPKQFLSVYIGVAFEQSANGSPTSKSKRITIIVTLITGLITIFAMRYIRREINRVKPAVIYARRKARHHNVSENFHHHSTPGNDDSTVSLHSYATNDTPLNPHTAYAPI